MLRGILKVLRPFKFSVKYSEHRYNEFLIYNNDQMKKSATERFCNTIKLCFIPVFFTTVVTSVLFVFTPLPPIEAGFVYRGIFPAVTAVASGISSSTLVFIFKHFFPEMNDIPRKKILLLLASGSCCYTLTLIAITKVCYPFPFSILVPLNVTLPIMAAQYYYYTMQNLAELTNFKRRITAFLLSMTGFFLMCVLYPASFKLYRTVKDQNNNPEKEIYIQLGFSFYLFILKRIFKAYYIEVSEYGSQVAPSLAVLMVNGYHAIYVSIMMQDGVTWTTLAVIATIDIAVNIVTFMDLIKLRRRFKGALHWTSNTNISSVVGPVTSTSGQNTERELQKHLLVYSEYFVFVEYIECLVPTLMAILLLLLSIFDWNLKYYTYYKDLDSDDLVDAQVKLWTYAILEIGILILLRFLSKHVDIPLWKHLGFILHQYMKIIVALLTTWMLYVVAGSLVQTHTDWRFECRTP